MFPVSLITLFFIFATTLLTKMVLIYSLVCIFVYSFLNSSFYSLILPTSLPSHPMFIGQAFCTVLGSGHKHGPGGPGSLLPQPLDLRMAHTDTFSIRLGGCGNSAFYAPKLLSSSVLNKFSHSFTHLTSYAC